MRAAPTLRRCAGELRILGHRSNLADALAIQAMAHAAMGAKAPARALMHAAAAIPRPVETALPMLDFAALLLAEDGKHEIAATLGFADIAYAANQERRFGCARDAERRTTDLIERVFGVRARELRSHGATLGAPRVLALAHEHLGAAAAALAGA